MKKFFALFIAILSVVCFNSCEDKEELKEYKYRLQANESHIFSNIVIHEIDKAGSIVNKHSIYELKKEEFSQTFTSDEKATLIYIYAQTDGYLGKIYVRNYEDIWRTIQTDEINTIKLGTWGEITEEEYNFYVNQ